ncbi:ABC transporter permease [Ignavigranum ruoffiae]|uniref:ABC-2 type transport system permease protein n=1 Tax=Ignavigranum ruoffiae TaxID=89093 RepID=A0A1H9BYI9_9LACT|nr:ABC transporter permease [Ignavigranum ruoffiae]SEP93982.1 ABC-2 type transport system permease protein [Ignavigranum ruoffiae]
MKPFINQFELHFKRLVLRDLKSYIAALIFPIFFYYLYTRVFAWEMSAEMLKIWQLDYMISMIIYGNLITSIQVISSSLVKDHQDYFDLFVILSPKSKFYYYWMLVLVYFSLNALIFMLISSLAFFLNQVSLPLLSYLVLLVFSLFASAIFSLLGILLAQLNNSLLVNILTNLLVFPLAILGGLWWPIEIMPGWLQDIGKLLPTYQSAALCRQFIHQGQMSVALLLHLLSWALGLSLLILVLVKWIPYKEPKTS